MKRQPNNYNHNNKHVKSYHLKKNQYLKFLRRTLWQTLIGGTKTVQVQIY